jgi:hypothetical protein
MVLGGIVVPLAFAQKLENEIYNLKGFAVSERTACRAKLDGSLSSTADLNPTKR